MPPIADRIREKIEKQLQTKDYVLTDESAKHAGHAGARAKDGAEGETHFHLRVIAPVFSGLSRVARQRLVYDLLKAEMDERVHALSLELKSPDEI